MLAPPSHRQFQKRNLTEPVHGNYQGIHTGPILLLGSIFGPCSIIPLFGVCVQAVPSMMSANLQSYGNSTSFLNICFYMSDVPHFPAAIGVPVSLMWISRFLTLQCPNMEQLDRPLEPAPRDNLCWMLIVGVIKEKRNERMSDTHGELLYDR